MANAVKVLFLVVSALFPIEDPLSGSPVFLARTNAYSRATRRELARRVAIDSFFLMLGCYFIGSHILSLLGVSLPVVQVGGGLIVVTVVWSMLMQSDEGDSAARKTIQPHEIFQRAFYPLTLPLTVGPGSISVAITLGANATHRYDVHVLMILAAVMGTALIGLSIFLCYGFADRLAQVLGATAMTVIVRLSSFLLVCIGVQITWNGVAALLSSVISHAPLSRLQHISTTTFGGKFVCNESCGTTNAVDEPGSDVPGRGLEKGGTQVSAMRSVVYCSLFLASSFLIARATFAQDIVVDATPSHAVNSFSPLRALGGAFDRQRGGTTQEEIEKHTQWVLSGPALKELLGSGWQTVTYRQNTELQIEAWHWNPRGTWSNATKKEGYFTGSAVPSNEEIVHSWAYPLPHRGATLGDGTGWSRLTDGDPKSYWKSNPYLTKAYTGEDDSLHPQWVMIDLGKKVDINAIRIAWANPYATRYYVQFWTGELEPFYAGINRGTWQTFPMGTVTDGKGGTPTLRLVNWSIPVRYLRIWMVRSSDTCDTHGPQDKRNCVGYAINELYIGTATADGQFNDVVKHTPSRQQTITWPSSVDPWHAASDLDYGRGDQVGFDYFFKSGITRGLPTMVPIAILYTTPEDAANEIAYLYKRKYPISWIEMGEEADGQRVLPEDYATLYIQFARAIHKLVPNAPLGGPAFEGTPGDVDCWADANGRVSFLGRFVDYLKAHDDLKDFTFFSFEHYPCMGTHLCGDWTSLYYEPQWVNHVVQAWKDNGLPPNIPFFMTEGNDFGDGGPETVKTGLWLADYVGAIMTAGASGTYYFHYVSSPGRRGHGLLSVDDENHVLYSPQYLAAQLITQEWVQPVDAVHKLYRATSNVTDKDGNILVTAYPVERPDGQWSVMLINKDQNSDHSVRLVFADAVTKQNRYFSGSVDRVVFGPTEYQWHVDPDAVPAVAASGPSAGEEEVDDDAAARRRGPSGHAEPDGPASKSSVTAEGASTLFELPKASIVVLRGKLVNP